MSEKIENMVAEIGTLKYHHDFIKVTSAFTGNERIHISASRIVSIKRNKQTATSNVCVDYGEMFQVVESPEEILELIEGL